MSVVIQRSRSGAADEPGYDRPPYLRDYWRVVSAERRAAVALLALCTLVATAVAFLWPPTYEAEVLLAPVPQSRDQSLGLGGQFADIATMIGLTLGPRKDRTAEHLAALRSRSLAMGFVQKESLRPVLFPERWDAGSGQWKGGAPTDWEAYERFDEDVRSVSMDWKSGLITLRIEWSDPETAARWANALVQFANERLRADAIEDATRRIAYLQKEVARTGAMEVRQAIFRLIEAETKRRMMAATNVEYAFEVIDPAVTPEERAWPKRVLMIATGFLVGVMLSVTVAFVRRAWAGPCPTGTDPATPWVTGRT